MNTKLTDIDLYGRIVRTAILAIGIFCIALQAGYAQPAIKIANKQITITEGVTADMIAEIKKVSADGDGYTISLQKIKSNDDIAKICNAFPNVSALIIRAEKEITSIAPVAKLKSVTNFQLYGSSVTDYMPISGLTTVTFLYVQQCPVGPDLKWLSRLTKLTSLSIWGDNRLPGGTKLVSFEGIPDMPGLRSIQISDAAPASLAPLQALSSVRSVELRNSNLTDLSPLTGIPSLEKLNFYGSTVRDFTPLSGCKKLKEVNFYATKNADYSTLSKVTQLEILHGGLTELKDISWITALTNLKAFHTFAEYIEDFTPLTKLKLEELKLWDMRSKTIDLGFLSGIPTLKKLNLESTENVSKINTIQSLANLESLTITKFNTKGGDPVPLDIIKKLPNLKELVVFKGQFTKEQLSGFANPSIKINERTW